MNSVLIDVIKVFVLDIIVLLSLFVVVFFVVTLINSIRNGKAKKITKEGIMSYSFDHYIESIKRNLGQLIKWFVILFAVHLIVTFFSSLLNYLSSSITYDNVPVIALCIDIIKPIFNVIAPFYIPSILIIAFCLLVYAFIKTCNEVNHVKTNNESIVKAVDDIIIDNASLNSRALPEDKKLVVRKKRVIKVKKSEEVAIFTENLQRGFIGIAKFLPKLFIVLTVCIALNSLFLTVTNITKTFDNYKKIHELNVTIKNLSNSESFARISLLNTIDRGSKAPIKTYKVDILNNDGNEVSTQTFQLEGKEIVIDSININFDYSVISNGEKYNIAYPYRIYTELLPPSKAKPLTCLYNDEDVPVIYMLEKDDIYGLSEDSYYNSLKEIFHIIKDDNLSREMGIKSTIGNALHFVMNKGDVIDINIEGTGGLSASKHETLFSDEEKESFRL